MYRQFVDRPTDSMIREAFGSDVPSVTELSKNISLILVNQHYSLSGVKPLSPAVIEVGGIHIKEAKPIEEVTICSNVCAFTPKLIFFIQNFRI